MLKKALDNNWINFLVFTTLTIFALLQGQISVFYIMYLFWWEELIRIIVNAVYNRTYRQYAVVVDATNKTQGQSLLGAFFMLGIYLIFLVVFFGLMANWDNKHILFINIEVLLFRNWFFNINLIFILINQIGYRRSIQQVLPIDGPFTPNMIVLHISIIVGAVLNFFVVDRFPKIFTSENLLGSVLMILPFFLLRYFIQRKK